MKRLARQEVKPLSTLILNNTMPRQHNTRVGAWHSGVPTEGALCTDHFQPGW
ncbi:hypothetical protein LP416_28155 [Polaromonas sp. P2-4]|nr:hypothetical protein LP416_28155 [Polaromonas sp. P2-4]